MKKTYLYGDPDDLPPPYPAWPTTVVTLKQSTEPWETPPSDSVVFARAVAEMTAEVRELRVAVNELIDLIRARI